MSLARRHVYVLRLLLVAWVACGLLLKPVIGALSELHAFEHASALDAGAGHGHGSGHGDEGVDHHHAPLQAAPDGETPHDLAGLHGLLHACSGMSPAAMLELPALGCTRLLGSDPPSMDSAPGRFASHPSFPFRPPIA